MFSRLLSSSRTVVSQQSRSIQTLQERMKELVPQFREKMKRIKTDYGKVSLGEYTVGQTLGGMRGMPTLLYDTSLLDPQEGIHFRGLSIPELQKLLPKAEGGHEPLPEGLLWLLLTGEIPTVDQVRQLTRELNHRSKLPENTRHCLNSISHSLHPMTQLSMAVLSLQKDSKFYAAYQKGIHKTTQWEYVLEDALDLIAKLPEIAALIYRNTFHPGGKRHYPDPHLDLGANLAHQMGFESNEFKDLMRLYLTVHSDHEGGNVSAHATHLVGSTLADPYLAYTAGMNGLAGPLHGLANQESLRFLLELKSKFKSHPTKEELEKACWDILNSGRVIPGFGHAVLRKTDPRYTCFRRFSQRHLPHDPLFKLVSDLYEVAPKVLTAQGKTANPWPNVDAHSGVVLYHYGLVQDHFYTVLFGVSRCLGVMSSLVLDRVYGFPIERPGSLTLEAIEKRLKAKK